MDDVVKQVLATETFLGSSSHVSPKITASSSSSSSSWLLLCCKLSILFLAFAESGRNYGVSATTFTFINSCSYGVAVGLQQNTNLLLLENGGFQLPVGVSQPVSAPAGWSGRFWGRTGCNFDANGLGKCVTGDCGGVLECNGAGGAPPATLVQVVVGDGVPDQYDVSLVNGYNLPVQIAASGGTGSCGTAGCISNLNTKCPPALQVANNGVVVACNSACDAFNQPQYCCNGYYNTPGTCPPTPYSEDFKSACPMAWTYAFDTVNTTYTCSGASYTITFCPAGSSGIGEPAAAPAPGTNSASPPYSSSPPSPPAPPSETPGPGSEPSGPAEGPTYGSGESWATALSPPPIWCFLLISSLATLIASSQLVNCL
ncbi:hypothetical protein BDL97_17G073700 [Sphagnum fallax]|nr:hypothetical protein BDL97_17G073700 [Sphagnum fallax]